jgi:hypothetical protein
MSIPTAKDLLAQADRLMRQRTPEELPVLTDLVIEEIEITSLTDYVDDPAPAHARPAWSAAAQNPAPSLPPVTALAPEAPIRPNAPPTDMRKALAPDVLGERPVIRHNPAHLSSTADPTTVTAIANVRDQFNAQLLTKLEELQHGVYSQVMQQLEIYAAGSLKDHIRDMLLPALTDMARDIAQKVADDTSTQVREVVSKAVDSEIARLREQLSKRRT